MKQKKPIEGYTEEQKEEQKQYNKTYESTIDGIILKAFEFFESIAGKLNEEEIDKFQSGFNKKQLKKINKVTEEAK